jgi:hypothetical protein
MPGARRCSERDGGYAPRAKPVGVLRGVALEGVAGESQRERRGREAWVSDRAEEGAG